MRVVVGFVAALCLVQLCHAHCSGNTTCGNADIEITCPGVCCNDSLNAWCCPGSSKTDFVCAPSFQNDPDRCHAPNSCFCVNQDIVLLQVDVRGDPVTLETDGGSLSTCCDEGSQECGIAVTNFFEQRQTLSWSTLSTLKFLDAPNNVTVGGGVGAVLNGPYLNGQTRIVAAEVQSTNCQGDFSHETFVSVNTTNKTLRVPVTFVYSLCGMESGLDGILEVTEVNANGLCSHETCNNGCSPHGCYSSTDQFAGQAAQESQPAPRHVRSALLPAP